MAELDVAGGALGGAHDPLGDGAVVKAYIEDLSLMVGEVVASNEPDFVRMAEKLGGAVKALAAATHWMGEQLQSHPEAALASATPYLRLFGIAAGGAYLGKSAVTAVRNGEGSGRAVMVARYFAENVSTEAPGLADAVTGGADAVLAATPERLEG